MSAIDTIGRSSEGLSSRRGIMEQGYRKARRGRRLPRPANGAIASKPRSGGSSRAPSRQPPAGAQSPQRLVLRLRRSPMEENMSAVLLAVFPDYDVANRVRMDLFEDGFPTDRIDLCACCEPGRSALQPGTTQHRQFVEYFGSLLCGL